MYCHGLEVMSLNSGQVELGVRSRPTSGQVVFEQRINTKNSVSSAILCHLTVNCVPHSDMPVSCKKYTAWSNVTLLKYMDIFLETIDKKD